MGGGGRGCLPLLRAVAVPRSLHGGPFVSKHSRRKPLISQHVLDSQVCEATKKCNISTCSSVGVLCYFLLMVFYGLNSFVEFNISVITLKNACLEKLVEIVDITHLIDWPLDNTFFSGSLNYGLAGELLLENVFIVSLLHDSFFKDLKCSAKLVRKT